MQEILQVEMPKNERIVFGLRDNLAKLQPFNGSEQLASHLPHIGHLDDSRRTVGVLDHLSACSRTKLLSHQFESSIDNYKDRQENASNNAVEVINDLLQSKDPLKKEQGQWLAKKMFDGLIGARRFLGAKRDYLSSERNPQGHKYLDKIRIYPGDPSFSQVNGQVDYEIANQLEQEAKKLFSDNEIGASPVFVVGKTTKRATYETIKNLSLGVAGNTTDIPFTLNSAIGIQRNGSVSFSQSGIAVEMDLGYESKKANNDLQSLPSDTARKKHFGLVKDADRDFRSTYLAGLEQSHFTLDHTPYSIISDAVNPTNPRDKAQALVRNIVNEPINKVIIVQIENDLNQYIVDHLKLKSGLTISIKNGKLLLNSAYSSDEYIDQAKEGIQTLEDTSSILGLINQYFQVQTDRVNLFPPKITPESTLAEVAAALSPGSGGVITEAELLPQLELALITDDSLEALRMITQHFGIPDVEVPQPLALTINRFYPGMINVSGKLDHNTLTTTIEALPLPSPEVPYIDISQLQAESLTTQEKAIFDKKLDGARKAMERYRKQYKEKTKDYLTRMDDRTLLLIMSFNNDELSGLFPKVRQFSFDFMDQEGNAVGQQETIKALLKSWIDLPQATKDELFELQQKGKDRFALEVDLEERFAKLGPNYEGIGSTSWFDFADHYKNSIHKNRLKGSPTLEALNKEIEQEFVKSQYFQNTSGDFSCYADLSEYIEHQIRIGKTPLEAFLSAESDKPEAWKKAKQITHASLFLKNFTLTSTRDEKTYQSVLTQETVGVDNGTDIKVEMRGVQPPSLIVSRDFKGQIVPYGSSIEARAVDLRQDRTIFIGAPNNRGKSQLIKTLLAITSGAPAAVESGGSAKIIRKPGFIGQIHSFITRRGSVATLSEFQNEGKQLLEMLTYQTGVTDESGKGSTHTMQKALQITSSLLKGTSVSIVHDQYEIAREMKRLLGDDEFTRSTEWCIVDDHRQLVHDKIAMASGGAQLTAAALFTPGYLDILEARAKERGVTLKNLDTYKTLSIYLEKHPKKRGEFMMVEDLEELGYGSDAQGHEGQVLRALVGLVEDRLTDPLSRTHASNSTEIAMLHLKYDFTDSILRCFVDEGRKGARARLAKEFLQSFKWNATPLPGKLTSALTGLGIIKEPKSFLTNLSALISLTHIEEGETKGKRSAFPVVYDIIHGTIDPRHTQAYADLLLKQKYFSEPTKTFLRNIGERFADVQKLGNAVLTKSITPQEKNILWSKVASKLINSIKGSHEDFLPKDDRDFLGAYKEKQDKYRELVEERKKDKKTDPYQPYINLFFGEMSVENKEKITQLFIAVNNALPENRRLRIPEDSKEKNPLLFSLKESLNRRYYDRIDRKEDNNHAQYVLLNFIHILKTHYGADVGKFAASNFDELYYLIQKDVMGRQVFSGGNSDIIFDEIDPKELLETPGVKEAIGIIQAEVVGPLFGKLMGLCTAKSVIDNLKDVTSSAYTTNHIEPTLDFINANKHIQKHPFPLAEREKRDGEMRSLISYLRNSENENRYKNINEKLARITTLDDGARLQFADLELLSHAQPKDEKQAEHVQELLQLFNSGGDINVLIKIINNKLKVGQLNVETATLQDVIKVIDRLDTNTQDFIYCLVDSIADARLYKEQKIDDRLTVSQELIDTMTIYSFSDLMRILGNSCYGKTNGKIEMKDGFNIKTIVSLGNKRREEQINEYMAKNKRSPFFSTEALINEGKNRFHRMSISLDSPCSISTGRNGGGKTTLIEAVQGMFVPESITGLFPAASVTLPKGLNKIRFARSKDTGTKASAHTESILSVRNALRDADEHTLVMADEPSKGTGHDDEIVENQAFIEYCIEHNIPLFLISHDEELVNKIKAKYKEKVGLFGVLKRFNIGKTRKYMHPGSTDELIKTLGWPKEVVELVEYVEQDLKRKASSIPLSALSIAA